MGTRGGFTKRVRHLFRPYKPYLKCRMLVDVSYVLYKVTRLNGLGYEMLTLDPNNHAEVTRVVQNTIVSINAFLAPLNPSQHTTIYFLEGSIPKARHDSTSSTRTTTISKSLIATNGDDSALGRVFQKHRRTKAKRFISRAYGRPPPWLEVKIAEEMRRQGYTVSFSETVENDFRICKAALDKQNDEKTIVVGSDSDYLVLSPPGSVDALVKIEGGPPITLIRDEILQDLKVDEFKLLLAYCIGGCDNIQAHVNGIGWGGGFEFAASCNINFSTFQSMEEVPLPKGKRSIKAQMATEIKAVLSYFGWKDFVREDWNADFPHILPPDQSEMLQFATETDNEGYLCQPNVYKAVFKRLPEANLVKPRPAAVQTTPAGTKAPKIPVKRLISLKTNRFFVLSEFEEKAQHSFSNNLHLDEEERSEIEKAAAAAKSTAAAAARKTTANGKRKRQKKKASSASSTGNPQASATTTETGIELGNSDASATLMNESNEASSTLRRSSRASRMVNYQDVDSEEENSEDDFKVDSHTPASDNEHDDSEVSTSRRGGGGPAKSSKQKPKKTKLAKDDNKELKPAKPSKTVNFSEFKNPDAIPRPKAPEECKNGSWDPGQGNATIAMAGRKSIYRKYEV